MKKIFAFSFILLFFSCKKSSPFGDHFIFGTHFSECSDCVHLFMLKNDKLYPDNMEDGDLDNLRFKWQKLSDEKVVLAKNLFNRVPEGLKHSASQTVGSPNSHDQAAYFIEIKDKTGTRRFDIDPEDPFLTGEIEEFIRAIDKTIAEL